MGAYGMTPFRLPFGSDQGAVGPERVCVSKLLQVPSITAQQRKRVPECFAIALPEAHKYRPGQSQP